MSREQRLAAIMMESLLELGRTGGSPVDAIDELLHLLSAFMDLRIIIDRCIDYNDINYLKQKAMEDSTDVELN